MTHRLTLQDIQPVTPDTHKLVFARPEGFTFEPGQAVDLALDRDGWRDKARPFTFTGLPDAQYLEFTIKSYPDHDGVTEQIGQMQPGDQVLVEAPWGAIRDRGPGVFIAGGAGITPFLAILRHRLAEEKTLEGCTLLFANDTPEDIILRRELESMKGLRTVFTTSEAGGPGVEKRLIDADLLAEHVAPGTSGAPVYLCGPPEMMDAVQAALGEVGVGAARIVVEDLD